MWKHRINMLYNYDPKFQESQWWSIFQVQYFVSKPLKYCTNNHLVLLWPQFQYPCHGGQPKLNYEYTLQCTIIMLKCFLILCVISSSFKVIKVENYHTVNKITSSRTKWGNWSPCWPEKYTLQPCSRWHLYLPPVTPVQFLYVLFYHGH